MKNLFSVSMVVAIVCLLLSCSASKEQLKQTLIDNPDIIFDVFEKHPARFADVMQKVSMEARKAQQEKMEQEAKAQMEDEFKNPKVAEVDDERPIRGSRTAPITIVEYSDFQCPYCQRGNATVEQIRQKYGDKVRLVFKHLPLDFHPLAMPAAKRFEAIALQSPEKAWQFHDEIFKNQNKLSSDGEKFLDSTAKKLGVNMVKMKRDMESDKLQRRIASDIEEAQKFGISGTPGFIVGGVAVKGAYPPAHFEQIIERKLSSTTK